MKITRICTKCKDSFTIQIGSNISLCSNCRDDKKNQEKSTQKPENISKTFDVKIETEGQRLGALEGNAAAFQAAGGAPLMITEHVENGIDAIKQNKKNSSEGGNSFSGIGKIDVEIDDDNSEVRIIDNGTGILEPIHVIENPFKSLKTGADYVGHFGRGLHGFRGFCETLTYITLRSQISQRELSEFPNNTSAKCIKIIFRRGSAQAKYEVVNESEFEKYTSSKTGTVAVLSDWLDFDQFVRNRNKIFDRLQHHFGEEIKSSQLEISIKKGKKIEKITPREFPDETKAKFQIKPFAVRNPVTGEEYGNIEFFLYQSSTIFQHEYKFPYLLVKKRPLQDSFLSTMEEFKDEKIWSSQYITGYIKCDFVEPNQLRLALENDMKKKNFVTALKACTIEIKKQLNEYIENFMSVQSREEHRELTIDIQKFLKKWSKKNKIILQFNNLSLSGKLAKGEGSEDEDDERVSPTPGSDNKGLVTKTGTMEVEVFYKKHTYIEIDVGGNGGDGGTTATFPNSDGRAIKKLYIDEELLSKGGRKKRKSLQGPGLDFEKRDMVSEMLSWYEPSRDVVVVNTGNKYYVELYNKAKKSPTSTSTHSNKLKNYVAERYFWHLIMTCTKDKTQIEKENLFWDAYHGYFIHKDTN